MCEVYVPEFYQHNHNDFVLGSECFQHLVSKLIHLGPSYQKWTESNTSVNVHQDGLWCNHLNHLPRLSGTHLTSFCSANANVSWCVFDKDVTGKYLINAGHGGCFWEGVLDCPCPYSYVLEMYVYRQVWTVMCAVHLWSHHLKHILKPSVNKVLSECHLYGQENWSCCSTNMLLRLPLLCRHQKWIVLTVLCSLLRYLLGFLKTNLILFIQCLMQYECF